MVRPELSMLGSLPALALVALQLSAAPATAQPARIAAVDPGRSPHAAAVDAGRRWVGILMTEANLPGLQVAVMKEGRMVWSEGFGFADLEQRTALTPDTRLRIGSVSKPLTATAVLKLHEAGRLDLDADVRGHVPSFPEKRDPVTSRQLLGHLGGIRHYRDDESTIRHESYADVLEALEIFAGDSLLHRPGTAYGYSSYGYNLLAAVVREASGRPFLAYVREAVLEPAGMTRTVAEHLDSVIPHRAEFYRESEVDGRLLNAPFTDNSYKWASGGYLSTAEDLVRFVSSLLDGELVRPGLVDTMTTSMVTTSGDTTGYGMGWRPRIDAKGRRVIRHGGSSVGGRAFLTAYRDHGLAVAILVNASRAPIFHQEAEVLAHLFLDHPPDGEQVGAGADRIAGTYEFTSRRGEEGEVRGTLHLTGSRRHPGWMEWEGADAPVPLVLVDPHPDRVRLFGAGGHGALTLWTVFDDGTFRGRWDWLGRTSEIEGRRDGLSGRPPSPELRLSPDPGPGTDP